MSRDEDTLVSTINSIIPILNGNKYPEELIETGPESSSIFEPKKSKLKGPRHMIKNRYLILLYVGKRITDLADDYGERINDIVYFSTNNINRIATYERFRQIDFDHHHAHLQYLKYKEEGYVYSRISEKCSRGLVFALTEKGEQYCNRKINDYLIRVAGKTPKIVSLPRGFDELQKELLNNYGLHWLARDYFESRSSLSNDLDNWRKGFPFELPSIKSRQELRREGIIRDIRTKLENEKKILIVGPSGSSKSTILMELMCDYFDAGYEIFHNIGISELKNIDGLVNFIEGRLKMKEKILVAVDNAHYEGTNSIFYVVDKLSDSDLTNYLRFVITARIPEFEVLRSALGGVHEELRKSIRRLTDEDMKFVYRLPNFTKEETRDFVKLYLKNIDNGKADKLSQEVYDYSSGDPIMVKFAVLRQGLQKDVKEMNDRYLGSNQKMKTMLICSLLDMSIIPITDKMLELCGVLESAYHMNGSILRRNTETGLWKTKHPRWDQELFSFLYSSNTITIIPDRRKQDLKDALVAINGMGEETITYSALIALYDMVIQNFIPIELFEVVFKESISQKPRSLSKPKVSSIFELISEAYYILKKYQNAHDSSNEALKWNLRNAMAYDKKGAALTNLGKNNKAVECFDKALDIDPSLAPVWMHRGYALDNMGYHEDALVSYDRALKIDPNYEGVMTVRGLCFHRMGKYEKAVECYDNALDMNKAPTFLSLLVLVPFAYRDDMRDKYLMLRSLDESYILSLKGTSLLRLKRYKDAMRCFDKSLKINPNDTNAWYNKGVIFVELGKHEDAINAYQMFLNISPYDASVWLRKGILLCHLGNDDEAVDCYDHVLKIDSDHGEALYLKGQSLFRSGRTDAAQFCFDKAKKLGFNINTLRSVSKN